MNNIVEVLADIDPEIIILDDLNEAILGYIENNNSVPVALYDRDKCIEILMDKSSLTEEDAIDYFEYNIAGAYMGDYTPMFATLLR